MSHNSHNWAPTRRSTLSSSDFSPDQSNGDARPSGLNSERAAAPAHDQEPESFEKLRDRIKSLESENEALKVTNDAPVRWETLYFIQGGNQGHPVHPAHGPQTTTYLDEPTWAIGPRGEVVLRARFPIADIDGYLRQKPDVAFVVAKWYTPRFQEEEVELAARDKKKLPLPLRSSETIRLHSKDMVAAAEEFFGRKLGFLDRFPEFNIRASLPAPYLFWYYHRNPGSDPFETLSPLHQDLMRLLTGWIDENYGKLYSQAEEQLKRGKVSYDSMEFLIRPGDVVVSKDKRTVSAAIAKSWPMPVTPREPKSNSMAGRKSTDWTRNPHTIAMKPTWKWSLKCWEYKYDGQFYKNNHSIGIVLETEDADAEIDICELESFPLQYADNWKDILQQRGKTFWSCRYRRLVSYHDDKGLYGNGDRFMIDFDTYRQLHSDSAGFKREFWSIDDAKCEHMDSEIMSRDEPPQDGGEVYVFPRTIAGYNLRSKKWVDLDVDSIREVEWNKQSFDHLVVDMETKELVQALITNQISREQSTDIIDQKGNGLVILLHGGPGTGKTFTAESVAEMAEKPLFRVTCGDIGTKPEDVEKYLESVLHLGKSWGCVVLLDEADVFLEQRTLTDLERNALVSVFLRVLEYYEGILILTSNRVGTFDEAFKSRIQLSLHYENLTVGQRTKIWKNFLRRLRDLDAHGPSSAPSGIAIGTEPGLRNRRLTEPMDIDFDDVESYVTELAEFEMNGRQIRNAITTARQLAKFKKQPMTFDHLKHVINVSSKFDKYLKKVQDGFSDDQIARGEGIR